MALVIVNSVYNFSFRLLPQLPHYLVFDLFSIRWCLCPIQMKCTMYRVLPFRVVLIAQSWPNMTELQRLYRNNWIIIYTAICLLSSSCSLAVIATSWFDRCANIIFHLSRSLIDWFSCSNSSILVCIHAQSSLFLTNYYLEISPCSLGC